MGAFAETFDRLFDDIFGLTPHKPRIRSEAGGWECRGLGYIGWGHTPQAAYVVWQRYIAYRRCGQVAPLWLRLSAREDRT